MEETKIDPLRRVFVPVERRTAAGTLVFKTLDNQVYARLEDGSIRRATPKVNGKQARKARQRGRLGTIRSETVQSPKGGAQLIPPTVLEG